MSYSTLFHLDDSLLTTEAEVETRLLARVFHDLGYPEEAIIPKKRIKPLKIHDGTKVTYKEADFLLKDNKGIVRVVVEAKDPSVNIFDAWGQAASYALSFNRDKSGEEKVRWLLISNGHLTGLFPHDSENPVIMLQLSDFASGMPPYISLRSYIKFNASASQHEMKLPFHSLSPEDLNRLFTASHNLVWKKEKLAPADAFFEFCKFIFIKINLDKQREKEVTSDTPVSEETGLILLMALIYH